MRPERPGPRAGAWALQGGSSSGGLPGPGTRGSPPPAGATGSLTSSGSPSLPPHPPTYPTARPSHPLRPYRPVSRAVGDGIRHASHGQASLPQFGDLLLHEEIVGIPAGLAVRHGKRGQASTRLKQVQPPRPRRAPALSNRGGDCARSPRTSQPIRERRAAALASLGENQLEKARSLLVLR